MSRTIALLTDFGLQDTYVGVMKGVIRGICPEASVIDLTHAIAPQNIRQGAFALLSAYYYFPACTIFLVVVDPGVGSERRPVAVQAGSYIFVAPDNGVLGYTLAEIGAYQAVELNNPGYRKTVVSGTFHGRDIFAPAAAHLAGGVPLDNLGTILPTLSDFSPPQLALTADGVTGEVMHIDHFGNVITSIGMLDWVTERRLKLAARFGSSLPQTEFDGTKVELELNNQVFYGIRRTYSESLPGEALAIVGSSGFLEVAINQGHCAARLGTAIGDPVLLRNKG